MTTKVINRQDLAGIITANNTRLNTRNDAAYVGKEQGKGLSSNDFTTAYKNKLDGLTATPDWSSIQNKPSLEGFESADPTILKQTDVVDSLNSTSTSAPLSAKQGKVLNEAITGINGVLESTSPSMTSQEIDAMIADIWGDNQSQGGNEQSGGE